MFSHGPEIFAAIMLILLGVFLYLLPTFIARARHHDAAGGITLVNIFLGWTVIFWVTCLIWAYSGGTNPDKRKAETAPPARACLKCGSLMNTQDRFCTQCGTAIPGPQMESA